MGFQIKAKMQPHNVKEVTASMAALGDLIGEFEKLNTQEEIDHQISRINGYTYALVNMDVITQETANTQVAGAVLTAAGIRQVKLGL